MIQLYKNLNNHLSESDNDVDTEKAATEEANKTKSVQANLNDRLSESDNDVDTEKDRQLSKQQTRLSSKPTNKLVNLQLATNNHKPNTTFNKTSNTKIEKSKGQKNRQ